jgi:hypothetical protein
MSYALSDSPSRLAARLRRAGWQALRGFDGGRIVVLIAGAPYPCPPAPYECALHLHEHLLARGLRDLTELAVATLQPMLMPNAGRDGSVDGATAQRARRVQLSHQGAADTTSLLSRVDIYAVEFGLDAFGVVLQVANDLAVSFSDEKLCAVSVGAVREQSVSATCAISSKRRAPSATPRGPRATTRARTCATPATRR